MGTIALPKAQAPGEELATVDARIGYAEFTFSASYTTGGEAFDLVASYPGLYREIVAVLPFQQGGYTFEWDSAVKKLKAFYGDYNNAADGVLIEVAAAVNVGAAGAVKVLVLHR